MSYSIRSEPDNTPARRPLAVTAAASLMVLMALVSVANVIAGLLSVDGIVRRFRSAAARTDATGPEVDGLVALLRAEVIAAAVVGVVVAVLLAALAVGNLRRSNAARIATWVLSVLGLICGGCALAAVAGQRAATLDLGADARTTEDLLRALDGAYPSWWVDANAGLSAAQSVGYLVVALLLAVPAANAYFRPPAPAPVYRPPASGPARPGVPPPAPPRP